MFDDDKYCGKNQIIIREVDTELWVGVSMCDATENVTWSKD